MRRAGLLVWQALELAESMVAPGVTTGEIDAAVEGFFHARGATSLFKGYPGKVPFPAVTCISVNEEVVHGIPGARRLAEGDIVSIDTGCKIDGWCGDSARTFPVGEIAPEIRRMLECTRGTLDLAIELIPKKTWWSQIAREMETYVKDHGFAVVEDFVGHGIGRQMHENPQVPNFVGRFLRRRNDFRVQPGLVVAVEPMVNAGGREVRCLADHWTQVTRDGKPSAHFEHTIGVAEWGAVVLTGAPGALPEEIEPGNLERASSSR